MVTSPATPPEGVTDADWAEQQEPTDPFEEFDATPTVRLHRSSSVEADEADMAEQDTVVPLTDDED